MLNYSWQAEVPMLTKFVRDVIPLGVPAESTLVSLVV